LVDLACLAGHVNGRASCHVVLLECATIILQEGAMLIDRVRGLNVER
jgi:hypothetical protein